MVKVVCRYCGRYLMDAVGTTVVEGVICTNSKCRARLNIKVVATNSDVKDIRREFTSKEVAPKNKKGLK